MNSFPKHIATLLAVSGAMLVIGIVHFSIANWQMPVASNIAVPTSGENEPAEQETEAVSGEDTVDPDAGAFALDVPDDWTVTKNRITERDDGVRLYEWISKAKTESPYPDSGSVMIQVKDELKGGRTFQEVAAGYLWDESDVNDIVDLMSSEAGDAFPDFSKDDIKIDSADDVVGGARAIRATEQCLKPCYVEGGAATTVRYIIDAPDRVYVLEVHTGTSEHTAGLLNEADAVIRTFKEE